MSHTVIYIESHIMCILFLGIMFLLRLKHWRPRYLNSLSAIYLITMFSSAMDIIWILMDGTNRHRWLYHLVNIAYLSCFEFTGFSWLNYCAQSFPFRLWQNKRQKFWYLLPALLITLLIALSPLMNNWVYGINAAGVYFRGPGFIIQPMGYLYMLAASCLSIKARMMATHTSEKKQFLAMALFPLPSLLLGVLQLIAPPGGLPTVQFAITLAILIEFIAFLEGNVTQDSLTGLSNRYALDRALNAKMNSRRNKTDELYVLMGDLDKFKSINDTYGHMEGDRALKLTADTLKRIFRETPAVLARLGGDEFAIILEMDSAELVRGAMARIQRELKKASDKEPFDLSISLGMAKFDGQNTATEFLKAADHVLYSAKKDREAH